MQSAAKRSPGFFLNLPGLGAATAQAPASCANPSNPALHQTSATWFSAIWQLSAGMFIHSQ